MIIEKNTRMTDEQINALVKAGFSRWTKYGKDRLYVTNAAIGLVLDHYNTGNIKYAELNGEWISNSRARDLEYAIRGAYIDIETGYITGSKTAIELIKSTIDNI